MLGESAVQKSGVYDYAVTRPCLVLLTLLKDSFKVVDCKESRQGTGCKVQVAKKLKMIIFLSNNY